MTAISNYAKNFVINRTKEKVKPYYNIHIEMDSNDGDYISGDIVYISGDIVYDEKDWNEKPDIFFLMLSYLDDHGRHYAENKHGLSDIIFYVAEYEDWLQYGEYDVCHSFTDIIITYFDEENRKHDVEFKTVDDIFDTEEEMIEAIKEAYNKWNATLEE